MIKAINLILRKMCIYRDGQHLDKISGNSENFWSPIPDPGFKTPINHCFFSPTLLSLKTSLACLPNFRFLPSYPALGLVLACPMPHVFPELLHVVCEFFPVHHLQPIFFHLADRISLLKCKFEHVIHLLNIFNTSSPVNVNRIACPVSLGWLSSDLFLHFKNPLLLPTISTHHSGNL